MMLILLNLKMKSEIELSKYDIKRGIKLPEIIDENLAYLCGVLAGDGNLHYRKNKYEYSLKCVGNPEDESEFYYTVVCPVFEKVFGIKLSPKLCDKKTTFGIVLYSKTVVSTPLFRCHQKLNLLFFKLHRF